MRKRYFTLVEIMIVVAIIGLLAAIAIPSFMRARTSAQTNACISNMRQIDGAIQQAMIDGTTAVAINADTDLVLPYIDGTSLPTCPASNNAAYTVDASQGDARTRVICPVVGDNATHVLP